MPSKSMLALALLSSSLLVIEGFSPLVQRRARIPSTTLQLSSLSADLPDELTYQYLFAKAREVAFSDNSSAAEAKRYLNMILEMESGCVTGTLAGHDLCDNVEEVAEVVANLRERAEGEDSVAVR